MNTDLRFFDPVQVLSNPWRIVFADVGDGNAYHDPIIYVLNLETAGYVDSEGNVIPDPAYPPMK